MLNSSERSLTFHFLKPYIHYMLLYGLCAVLGVLFMMSTALSVADFLRLLFGSESVGNVQGGNLVSKCLESFYVWMISHGQSQALWYFSALLILLFFFKNLFGYMSAVISGIIRNNVLYDIRNAMFSKALHLTVNYYASHREGDVLSRLGNDMAEYDENVLGSLHILVSSLITLVLYLLMLFYIDARLTVAVILAIPFIALVISRLSRRLKRTSQVVQEQVAALLSQTEETIRGLRLIKAFNAIDFSNERFIRLNARYCRHRTAMHRRINAASPVSEFLGNVVVIAVLFWGSYLILRHDTVLTAELFVSYLMLFVLMLPPAKNISTAVSQLKRGKGCEARIRGFLAVNDIENSLESKPSINKIGTVKLSDVTLFYERETGLKENTPALANVTFDILEGKSTALVGASGSGKSSIASLLLRFRNPTEGSITVDGCSINDFSLASWRSRIGLVAQEPQLFNDSVANNIAYGSPNATRQQIIEAARIADAHEFIVALPHGYDTFVGEDGAMLSGGQRQRLCIARALLRNPDILIFDEATSSLDAKSERMVQNSIDKVMKCRTSVVIAHRLSTIRNADQIIVLDKGRIVEKGTHNQLIENRGFYYRLLNA